MIRPRGAVEWVAATGLSLVILGLLAFLACLALACHYQAKTLGRIIPAPPHVKR